MRTGTEQRSRTGKKELAKIAPSHIRGIDIGFSDQEEKCYSFCAGDITVESDMGEPLVGETVAINERSWVKEYETERLAKIQRRPEKYKVGRIKPPVYLFN